MCRIFLLRATSAQPILRYLEPFAAVCEDSKEYQGHGWGMAWHDGEQWREHKQIEPIWESEHKGFGQAQTLLIHARSAFQNEGIEIANNMPFNDGRNFFIFNGELRGVRIREQGRIGAEKIFNYIKRFHKGDLGEAFHRAVDVIAKRTNYLRAMNILMSDGRRVYLTSRFSEDPEYFTMYQRIQPREHLYCSRPLPLGDGWQAIPNNTTMVI